MKRTGRRCISLFLFAISILAVSGIFLYSKAVTESVIGALVLCSTTLIPSLFPFLVLSTVLNDCPVTPIFNRIFSPLAHSMGLPSACGGSIFFGLIGGFPTGASLAVKNVSSHIIDRDQASRMLCGCIAAGPSFLILGVGAGMCRSKTAGYYLFAGHLAASLLCGILWRGKKRENADKSFRVKYSSFAESFVTAVHSSCSKLLVICGFAIISCVIITLLEEWGILSFLSSLISRITGLSLLSSEAAVCGMIEVTSGCLKASKTGGSYILLLSFITSLCSVSILSQLRSILKVEKISMRPFFMSRPVHAVISCSISYSLYHFFPPAVTASVSQPVPAFSCTPLASLLLLALSVYIFAYEKVLKNKEHLL